MNNSASFEYALCPLMGNENGKVSNYAVLLVDNQVIGDAYSGHICFNDYLMTSCVTTDGVIVKNYVLENGNKVSENWDLVHDICERFTFDEFGTLLKTDRYNLKKSICESTIGSSDDFKMSCYTYGLPKLEL